SSNLLAPSHGRNLRDPRGRRLVISCHSLIHKCSRNVSQLPHCYKRYCAWKSDRSLISHGLSARTFAVAVGLDVTSKPRPSLSSHLAARSKTRSCGSGCLCWSFPLALSAVALSVSWGGEYLQVSKSPLVWSGSHLVCSPLLSYPHSAFG